MFGIYVYAISSILIMISLIIGIAMTKNDYDVTTFSLFLVSLIALIIQATYIFPHLIT